VIQYTPHTLIAAFRLAMRLSYSGSDNRASVESEPEQITTTPEQAKSADALRSYHDRHRRSEVRPAMSSTRHPSSRFLLMVLSYGQSSQERGRGCSPPSINWLSGIAMTEQVLLEAPEPHRPRCSVRSSIQDIMAQFKFKNSIQPAGILPEVLGSDYALHDRMHRPVLVGVAGGQSTTNECRCRPTAPDGR
jgi:hypothetical protein